MRRRAVVVTLLALAVTLAPVAVLADHSKRAVASQHTDFGTGGEPAPDTLTNMSVVGSGDSASVALSRPYNPVDSQGDGDADGGGALVGDLSDGSTLNTETRLQPNATGTIHALTPHIGFTSGSGYGFTVEVRIVQETPDGTVGEGTVVNSSWDPDFSTGTKRVEIDPFEVQAGTNYTVEWITSGSDGDSTEDRISITGDTSATQDWLWNPKNAFMATYPNLTASIAPDSGTYTGANHTVEDATEAKVNMTVENATVDLAVIDPTQSGSSSLIGFDTGITSSGNHSVSIGSHSSSKVRVSAEITAQSGPTTVQIHDVSVLFDAESPTVDNASASPTGDLSQFQNTYTIDVNDADFPLAQGDSVTAELFIDGSSEGTDTLASNGTASVTATTSTGGSHTYNWTVTDDYGLSHTSQDFEVRIPATIEIFNETSPQTKISGQGDITVRSFAADTVIENTTSTGEIDMAGFPVDQEFVVKVSLDGYHDTTVVFDDIYQQQKIWLLNSSLDTNQVRFTLTDNTGDFQDDPKLLIERPLNHTGDNTTWEIIRADEFGAAGFTTNLETDTRHRLTVEAVDGAQRSVGPYTTSIDETVPLTIGSGRLNLTTGADSYTFNATYENASGTEQIRWGFADPDGLTTDLNVTIYEYQNASNRIYSQTFSDPSDLIATQMLTGNQPNLTWTVDWEATRDGETIGGKQTVGRFVNEQASALPAWLQEAVAIVVLMLTAGAFSQRNFAAGAVVVALMGGVFWMGGWLTGVTSGAGVAGALALGILYKWARDVR